jgi:ribosome-binding protein aMBF1 (putative translation factor)
MKEQTTTQEQTKPKKGAPKGKPRKTNHQLDSINLHPVNEAIWKRIRELWESTGQTQEGFAKENNWDLPYVKGVMQGRFTPSHAVLYELGAKYKKSMDWFYSKPIY